MEDLIMQKIQNLIRAFKDGEYQERLLDIYQDASVLEYQTSRYIKAMEDFIAEYGEMEVEIYSAPGRSEVGGNHTDHQHGQVLAASINLDIIAVAAYSEDGLIHSKSSGYDPIVVDPADLALNRKEEGTSRALIRGMAARFTDLGYKVGGFKAYMTSDVLSGSGLSSSAAFEVVVGNILSGLYNDMKIDPVTIAIASQYAENRYFGKPCGLMDQMACSVGGLINIDFKDPAEPVIRQVKVDFSAYHHSLCIVDTKGSHANLTDCYAAIPREMKKVAEFFGREYLRDVEEEDVLANIAALCKKCGTRSVLRAMHFFEDHKRVSLQVNALESGNFAEFLRLINESGNSSYKYLQNVYPSEMPDMQNVSVGLLLSDLTLKDQGASRVHGGGFAGTIQAFVPDDLVGAYRAALDACFGAGSCHVLKVRKYGGMKVLE